MSTPPPGDDSPDSAQSLGAWKAAKVGALLVAAVALLAGGNLAFQRVFRSLKASGEVADLEALIADELAELEVRDGEQSSAATADASRVAAPVNSLAPDIAFVDLAGEPGSLRESRGKTLVVSMTSATCPISTKLVPALVRLAKEFGESNVDFFAVNVDGEATPADLSAHAEQLPGWRYVHDKDGRLASALGAETTTVAYVIDRSQTLRYRGAVDDRFAVGVSRPVANEYLRDALVGVLHDQAVVVASTEAPGCLLTKRTPSDQPASAATWHNQIARLMQFHCVECHRDGEAAPFPLETYEQVVDKASMIQYVLDEKLMPPWFAAPGHGPWRNERVVPAADKELFRQWVAAEFAAGEPQDAPAPLARSSDWAIGKPDIVIEVPAQDVPAEGLLPWRMIPVELDLPEDLWIAAAEIRPSVPEVVHHAMLFVEYADDDPRRSTQTGGESGESAGATGFWSSYFPGRKAMILPPGRGKLIPKNGKVSVQLHYNPDGTARVDKTTIGLKVLPAPPECEVVSGSVIKWDFQVPPGSEKTFVHAETVGEDMRLLAIMPHMHYRGAAAQVFLQRLDGTIETLLHVPRYDFNWQVSYEFREPLLVTRGSRLIIRHTFDNSKDNLNNPDPAQTLVHGDDTTDEMMINFFDWEPAGDEPPPDLDNRPFE